MTTTNLNVTTVKEFNQVLSGLKTQIRLAARLISKTGALKTGQKLMYVVNGENIFLGTREAQSIHSRALNEYQNAAAKMFGNLKKAKKGKKRAGNQGFRMPFIVGPELVNFFKNANLGAIDPRQAVSAANPSIGDYLTFIVAQGQAATYVTTQAILTPLFAIYAAVNNLKSISLHNQGKPEYVRNAAGKTVSNWNGQWLGADATMKQHFNQTLTRATALSLTQPKLDSRAASKAKLAVKMAKAQAAPITGKTAEAQAKSRRDKQSKIASINKAIADVKPFSPDDFRYFDFQTLVMINRVPPNAGALTAAGIGGAAATTALSYVDRPATYTADLKRYSTAIKLEVDAGRPVDPATLLASVFPGGTASVQMQIFAALLSEQRMVSTALGIIREARKLRKKDMLAQ